MKAKDFFIGLFVTIILFFIIGYCIKHSENSEVSPKGVEDDLNYQWSHVKKLQLEVDSLKIIIIKMDGNQVQFLQHISTQNELNKEMLRNAQMQLRMNELLSKRIDSK